MLLQTASSSRGLLLTYHQASDVAAAATAAKVSELLAADGDEDLPTSVSDLQALVRSLQRRNASLVEETSFLREQHSSVSTIASEQAREASRLHAEVERKTKQLRTAVRQRDTHWKAIISARDSSEAQLRGTIKILTDQSRRTDDAIRHKAVMYDRMEAQCERMEMEHVPLKKRVEALGQRNEVLQAQVQALRARQMGADGGRGDGDENEHGRGHRHGRTRGSGSGSGSGSEEEDSAEETDMGEDADAGSDGGFGTESDAESTGDEGGGGGGGGNLAGEDYREQMRRKGYAVRQETASFASAYDPSQGPALQTAPGIAVQADQTQQVGLEAVPEGTVMDVLGNEVECGYEVEGGVCGLIADSREVSIITATIGWSGARHTRGEQDADV